MNNVLSDYLWARAVVLTTPTVATVGLSLTIPLAFVSDLFVKVKLSSVEEHKPKSKIWNFVQAGSSLSPFSSAPTHADSTFHGVFPTFVYS